MEDKKEVLVVEDDEGLNDIVCRYVKLAGCSARGALDGQTALRAVKEHVPSMVLLDLMLPDTTGFAVCEQLKRDDSTRCVPVVMMTALADDESRRRGLACGAIEYMTKPFDPDRLIAVIRKYAT
ncbi:MAG: response regulator [Tepidisphaeraceae bacterium]|jgi:DNA-binding response OmpR family regulator